MMPMQIVQLRGSSRLSDDGRALARRADPERRGRRQRAWQVSVNKEGDRLFLKPAQPDVSTNMTVVTSVRVYNFDLASLSGAVAGHALHGAVPLSGAKAAAPRCRRMSMSRRRPGASADTR